MMLIDDVDDDDGDDVDDDGESWHGSGDGGASRASCNKGVRNQCGSCRDSGNGDIKCVRDDDGGLGKGDHRSVSSGNSNEVGVLAGLAMVLAVEAAMKR